MELSQAMLVPSGHKGFQGRESCAHLMGVPYARTGEDRSQPAVWFAARRNYKRNLPWRWSDNWWSLPTSLRLRPSVVKAHLEVEPN